MERVILHPHITHSNIIPFPIPNPYDTQQYRIPPAMQQIHGAATLQHHHAVHAYATMYAINLCPPMPYHHGYTVGSYDFAAAPFYHGGVPVGMNSDDSRNNYNNLVNHYQSLLQVFQVPYMGVNNNEYINGHQSNSRHRLSGDEAREDLVWRSRELETISRHLKTRAYNENSEGNADKDGGCDVCAICLDEYKNNDRVGTLQCRHEYHVDCINKWLLKSTTCPVCRAPALSTV